MRHLLHFSTGKKPSQPKENLTEYYEVYPEAKRMKLLLGSLIALIVADGVISKFLIINRMAHEGNPFLQSWVIRDSFLAIKLLGAFLATLVLWKIYERRARLSLTVTALLVTFYTIVVFWSLYIFLRA